MLVATGAFAGGPAPAEVEPTALPSWQVLEYEQKAFMVTAHSRLELVTNPSDPLLWELQANSSVANNFEEVMLSLTASTGKVLERQRFSQGKDRRYKSYKFLPDYILRERRDPPKDSALAPSDWPLSSRKEIPYPALPAATVVTDAYALLELAGRFLGSDARTFQVVVNTEFNFYLVSMRRSDGPAIKVNYQVVDAAQATSGKRATRAVELEVKPLGEQPDKPDFNLLGLSGKITILFDPASDLPLQLRGTAPRLGKAEINLKGVTPRETGA
jgi:hypothetical protein